MNKIGIVLGVAVVATLAGCRDPEYARKNTKVQDEVKNVSTTPAATPAAKPVVTAPAPAPIVTNVRKCTCAPGTKHTEPCKCGADDCLCIVVAKPAAPVAPAAETVDYVVQRGDYLAKISKDHNVTIAAIRKLNPKMKGDVVCVGQKLKLPAGTAVAAKPLTTPDVAKPVVAKKAVSSSAKPYAGATKEYVVKNGDTLGAIAYSNGINIRQLKELNALTGDSLKIGQKLKVPADGKAVTAKKAEAKAAAKSDAKAEAKVETKAAPAVDAAKAAATDKTAAPAAAPVAPAPESAEAPSAAIADGVAAAEAAPAAAPAPAAQATTDYVVAEGDDLVQISMSFGVSIAVIRQLNNLGPNDQVKVGQVIKLPADAQKQ